MTKHSKTRTITPMNKTLITVPLIPLTALLITSCTNTNETASQPTHTTTATPIPNLPTDNKNITKFANTLIGQTPEQAQQETQKHGYTLRISSTNGTPHPQTQDYRPNRINITIKNNKITHTTIG